VAIRKWTVGAALALVAALAVASVGSAQSSKSDATPLKVAVVTDIGGLNDRGFNALANIGLQQAKTQLGVQGRVFISKSAGDYIPNLSTAARTGNQLVFAIGFLMGDQLAAVAKRFPNTKFAIVDFPWAALKGKPKNVRGILFAENEAGYLAGVAAAYESKSGTVSSVGGQAVPAVVSFLAGYKAGAKKQNPAIKVLSGYSQDFVDQAKCKELALNQIDQGSDVVFAAAGGCGLGALQAAKERSVWGIGVDSDQYFLGPHILVSATKKVNVGVFRTIKLTKEGKFKGGTDSFFNVKNRGVGYGTISRNAEKRNALIGRLNTVAARLANGTIKAPTK
jgi:basic membrane protein A and related proteins